MLILDEPTASLTERETQRLFTLIEQAKRQGVGIIYITHRMNEIKRIGDRITVLRDGRYVATLNVAAGLGDAAGRADDRARDRADLSEGPVPAGRHDAGGQRADDGGRHRVQRLDPGEKRRDRRARGAGRLRQVRGGARLLRRRTESRPAG